jgi:hypothetical protein
MILLRRECISFFRSSLVFCEWRSLGRDRTGQRGISGVTTRIRGNS